MRLAANLLLAAAVLALGACAAPSLSDLPSIRAPNPNELFRPMTANTIREKSLPPVAAEELVDAEGRCASAFVAAEPTPDPEGGAPAQPVTMPLIPSGIGLDMSECDVVKRAGHPERVQIGANERSERTAVLTYIRGERPGIYHFTSGRLTSLERAPEPPPEARPQRRQPQKKQQQQQRRPDRTATR